MTKFSCGLAMTMKLLISRTDVQPPIIEILDQYPSKLLSG